MQSPPRERQTGRARLRAWITRGKFDSDRQAAETLGVHPVVLSQWLSGTRRPDLDNAVRIEQITGIAVESWLQTDLSDDSGPDPVSADKPQQTNR